MMVQLTKDEARRAFLMIAQAIISSVQIAGDHGAPGGILYSALIGKMTLDQFEGFMSGLVTLGYLRKEGQLYFATGKEL